MRQAKNPFDRDPQNVPLMRFLLHSTSLADEILTEDSPAQRLIKTSSFREIEVTPLPTASNSLRKRFSGNGLALTEYVSSELRVTLKTSDGSVHNVIGPFIKYLPPNLWEPISSDSTVTLADLFASSFCDYLVVGTTEPSLGCKVEKDNIITAEQALEMVRVILSARGRFYLAPEMPISEWSFYVYRAMELFKGTQYPSTVASYAQGNTLAEKMGNYFASLMTRLDFICRAYDNIAFLSLKTANYNDQNRQLYHLAYYIMLTTGIFDDLAHIIEEFYQIRIRGRTNIILRIPPGKEPNKFYQTLKLKNAALYEFLTAPNTQRDINTFYPLRDSLQHRELPKGVQFHHGMSETRKNVLELNNETFEEIKEASGSLPFIIRGNPCLLDPYPFIQWAQAVTIELVNRILSAIDWDSICMTLPKDLQDEIRTRNENYKQWFGQLFGWPQEPLYF